MTAKARLTYLKLRYFEVPKLFLKAYYLQTKKLMGLGKTIHIPAKMSNGFFA